MPFDPEPKMVVHKGIFLIRPDTKSRLHLKFDSNKTQVEAERYMETQWDKLPGFIFHGFDPY